MMIEQISVLAGQGRTGDCDAVPRLDFNMGDVVSIVGHTGSGKTNLINDIEMFADGNTPSGRRILVNGQPPLAEYHDDPACNPVALITQHTTFLSDLPVNEFLYTHARIRRASPDEMATAVARTLAFANELTGEPIEPASRMTELSGGQTRALLIADATVICHTPIILLDEVENAGIHRGRTLALLRQHRKIFIFVTHDPNITLLSDYRVVMKGGRIESVLYTDETERSLRPAVTRLDDMITRLRDQLRCGLRLTASDLDALS
ncbi:MAG: ATP-binding cassette domain-containing protein [Rhodospirillaceae bacterium]